LLEMTAKGLGMTTIVDASGQLRGIFTDGDLRRALDQNIDFHHTSVDQVMTANCKTVTADMLAAEALRIMEDNTITGLVVVDEQHQPLGVVHLHDLIKAGLA
jgi:arabinose-5-phosphate isomerase